MAQDVSKPCMGSNFRRRTTASSALKPRYLSALDSFVIPAAHAPASAASCSITCHGRHLWTRAVLVYRSGHHRFRVPVARHEHLVPGRCCRMTDLTALNQSAAAFLLIVVRGSHRPPSTEVPQIMSARLAAGGLGGRSRAVYGLRGEPLIARYRRQRQRHATKQRVHL